VKLVLPALLLCASALNAQAPYPRIQANDNRVPAGVLKDGVLTLQLDVVRGMFHPDRDDDPGIDVLAFAEQGHAPSIPGPLIRVPRGTEIRTTVRNALADSAIIVYGLSGQRTPTDTAVIQPGASRDLVTRANASGTFMYVATTKIRPQRDGDDRMLVGGFVVDEPGAVINDRVMVIFQFMTGSRLPPSPFVSEILTINGKSWPNTERLSYNMGDTIRWRVINGSHDVHPMHLHGAYFTVLSRGDPGNDTLYSAQQRRQVVTERLLPLTTMMMQWTPAHAGNWVFHCHLTFHIMAHPPLGPMKASMDDHAMQSMGGLVIGTMVRGPIAPDARARRNIRLVVQQYDSVPGETGPPFSYHFDGESNTPNNPGPPIIVRRGEPIAITVVNRALEPTAVHWHGLEIESFYDGVHGFGGHGNVISPRIEPKDSFVARMSPPRAGTFIYHTHFDEARQQSGGLYGAFVVLEPGKKWDAEHDRIIILGSKRDTLDSVLINGREDAVMRFRAGESYRIRMINITLARPNIFVSLVNGDKPLEWNPVARDGADLPSYQTGVRPAKLQHTIGQTYDLLLKAPPAGEYALEVRAGNGVLLTKAKVLVE
jgi:FtsP/CotA-like multicopper oxidase with cupredoxin domain